MELGWLARQGGSVLLTVYSGCSHTQPGCTYYMAAFQFTLQNVLKHTVHTPPHNGIGGSIENIDRNTYYRQQLM